MTLANEDAQAADPAIQNFLALLSADMTTRPVALEPLSMEWLREARDLVTTVSVDLDAPLDPSDDR